MADTLLRWYTRFLALVDGILRTPVRGQGLAEYALVLALIAIVAIAALILLGRQVSSILGKVGSSI
jgi:Flp pilus assembly pilin Flp